LILKKILTVTLISLCLIRPASAQMDSRVKALGAMALYGTVGGALLGTASLAFGGNGRNIAKGASLGLYGGLIFGTYVVVSHAYKKHMRQNPQPQDNYYPGVQSPYEQGGYGDEADPQGGYRWNPVQEYNQQVLREQGNDTEWALKEKKTPIRVFLPLLNMSF
jgi:hypothetical protein